MDTSFWIQCNPKLTVEHTTKKYFGKYLYKLVVYCPAGRLIDSKGAMDKALEHRKMVSKQINYGGYWGQRNNKDLDQADVAFLDTMRTIRQDSAGIKLRVEEPRIQIYAATEQELINLTNTRFVPFKNYIESFAGPGDAKAEAVLNSGAIIRKVDIGYRYKVILRDGRYDQEVKQQLLQYLNNLGTDNVRVSKTGLDMLAKPTSYVWNLYLYVNDLSITTFINLISPGIVSNSHELVIASHK